MVLASAQSIGTGSNPQRDVAVPFYRKALDICRYLQSRFVDSDGSLTSILPPLQFHRFQNIYCTSANLVQLIDGPSSQHALTDYFRAVELAVHAPAPIPESERFTFRDLVLATCIAGYSASSQEFSESSQALQEIVSSGESETPTDTGERSFSILRAVHASGDHLAEALYQEGFGVLPTLMLRPEDALRLPMLLFPESSGVLPVVCPRTSPGPFVTPSDEHTRQTHQMTSTILLSLAKRFQDGISGFEVPVRTGVPLRVSPSLVLLLYYLALALSPSPSLYNNVGVLLSTLSSMAMRSVHGDGQVLSGQELAKAYYEKGLELDPTHPHLLTNFGSLLKDQGRTTDAIRCAFLSEQIN